MGYKFGACASHGYTEKVSAEPSVTLNVRSVILRSARDSQAIFVFEHTATKKAEITVIAAIRDLHNLRTGLESKKLLRTTLGKRGNDHRVPQAERLGGLGLGTEVQPELVALRTNANSNATMTRYTACCCLQYCGGFFFSFRFFFLVFYSAQE